MTIFDRYLLKRFFTTFIVSMICFVLVFNLVNLIERIGKYLEVSASFYDVFMYYVYFTPFIIILTCPIATLLAVIFSIGLLARSNELTAMKAAGVSLYRITLSMLLGGLIVASMLWVFGNYILPEANYRKNIIKTEKIDNRSANKSKIHRNQMFQGMNGRIFHFGNYITRSATGENVVIQTFKSNKLITLETIEKFFWQDTIWVGQNVVHKEFGDFKTDREPIKETAEKLVYYPHFKEKPHYFDTWFTRQESHSMSYSKLKQFTEVSEAIGRDVTSERVDLANKIAYPFINIIIILIGVAVASNPRRAGVAISFGISMWISFIFFTIVKVAIELGHQGDISPFLAAWGANILFLVLGLVLLYKVPK